MSGSEFLARLKGTLTALGACAALAVTLGAVTLAPSVTEHQDDAARWRALALAYVETSGVEAAQAPAAIQFASFAVESDETLGSLITAGTLDDLRSFDAGHLDAAREAARERQCLSEAIYYEARSEGFMGQAAVAEVVLNRTRHRAYPDTVCGVVYQGSERVTGCQFTFTCDGSLASAPYGRGWRRSQLVAEHALMGFAQPMTRRATHYHTTAIDPYWNDSLVRTRRIGTHVFYRFPNRSERQLLILEREA
jgi:spore germination cell wall hydrolase CwlJ-like protein